MSLGSVSQPFPPCPLHLIPELPHTFLVLGTVRGMCMSTEGEEQCDGGEHPVLGVPLGLKSQLAYSLPV